MDEKLAGKPGCRKFPGAYERGVCEGASAVRPASSASSDAAVGESGGSIAVARLRVDDVALLARTFEPSAAQSRGGTRPWSAICLGGRGGTGFGWDGSGPPLVLQPEVTAGAATFQTESNISDLFFEELLEVCSRVDGSADLVPGTDASTPTAHTDVRSAACVASASTQDAPTETETRPVVEISVGGTACSTSADVAVFGCVFECVLGACTGQCELVVRCVFGCVLGACTGQ